MNLRLLLLLSILSLACATGHARGDLVIIGGAFADDANDIWEAINAGRLEGRPIGVFGTASSNPGGSGQSMVRDLEERFGTGAAVYLDVTETNGAAEDGSLAAQAAGLGGFYFTGGDQRRVPRAFLRGDGTPTPVLAAVLEVHGNGGVVAGSSAGAAIMSHPMISGGTSANALEHGARPEGSGGRGVYIDNGLGFFDGGITDQHFLARGRFGRLVVATMATDFRYGFGVEENTALYVDGQTGDMAVLGAMGVIVVDTADAEMDPNRRITGVRAHYFDVGDRFNLATGLVEPAGKTEITNNPTRPPGDVESGDVWDRYEVWRLMTQLVDTPGQSEARGTDPGFDVLFIRRPGQVRAWRGGLHTYDNTRRAFTVWNLEVAVVLRGEAAPGPTTPLRTGMLLY